MDLDRYIAERTPATPPADALAEFGPAPDRIWEIRVHWQFYARATTAILAHEIDGVVTTWTSPQAHARIAAPNPNAARSAARALHGAGIPMVIGRRDQAQRDRVLMVSARLAHRLVFLDMDVIEAVLDVADEVDTEA